MVRGTVARRHPGQVFRGRGSSLGKRIRANQHEVSGWSEEQVDCSTSDNICKGCGRNCLSSTIKHFLRRREIGFHERFVWSERQKGKWK